MREQRKINFITRRETLKLGLLSAAGFAFAERFSGYAFGEDANLPPATRRAPAKAVIELWMSGGPSHLDTFDPKPQAGNDYCGPFKNPIATNVEGIQICELLPQLAKQADKYSIIRSMTHGSNAHETATYIMKTGRKPGDNLVFPGMGAVVSLFKGYDHGYKGLIPPYIVLTDTEGRFSEEGFLGPRYKPFATGGDPSQKRFVVSGVVAEGISDQRQKSRRELLGSLDSLGKAMPGNPQFEQLDQCEEKAYNLILGDSGKVFDMSNEKDELRDKYGRNKFGQSCLMARRLVEIGVPYITVDSRGWDTHKQNFETMRRKLPELDKGMATLLQDLSDRGLLDSTIVIWMGEFGRTPKIQWESPWNGGRGHYGNCFSAVVAGGGFKGGRVVGASDDKGEEVARRPVLAADLIGSIYELLGIDPDGPLPNPKGLALQVMPSTGRLKEIM
ncbi:MAG: DUF1501 domain-containing protein [Sedimentisphaerales bacterium]